MSCAPCRESARNARWVDGSCCGPHHLERKRPHQPGFDTDGQIEGRERLGLEVQVLEDDIAREDRDLQRLRVEALHIRPKVLIQVVRDLGLKHLATLCSRPAALCHHADTVPRASESKPDRT